MFQYCNRVRNTLLWHEAVNSGDRVDGNCKYEQRKVLFSGGKVPEQYFTQQMDYCAMLILWYVYMSFGLQIFVCYLSDGLPIMTAIDYSQIKISSNALSNCDFS